MRVGIVGSGFVGLTCAYRLAQAGVRVKLYDSSDKVGGLASGFSLPNWDWPLERFYHHIFSNDRAIIRLSNEVGWPATFYRPTTSIYMKGEIFPFDSALHLLRFPYLSFGTKLRMGAVLGFLKVSPFWKYLERVPAQEFLRRTMGVPGFEAIWKPLLLGKFGPHIDEVNAAWFWARVYKRTSSLGYFRHGFQGLADRVKEAIVHQGGQVMLNSPVLSVRQKNMRFSIQTTQGNDMFEKVLVTANTHLFLKMVPALPLSYRKRLLKLNFLDALVVVMVLRRPVMKDVYWLNITDHKLPFLVMVEHTNMIDAKHYNGNHILYLGSYLPSKHRNFKLSKSEILELAMKQVNAVSGNFKKSDIITSFVHRGKGIQPVVPVNYSLLRPTMVTPIPNLYLANISLVYPWDRGTNYAVELGEKAFSALY